MALQRSPGRYSISKGRTSTPMGGALPFSLPEGSIHHGVRGGVAF